MGVVAAACNGVLGIHELAATTGTPDSGVSDGGVDSAVDSGIVAPPEASVDAGTDTIACDLDATASDPLNCGACGHSCLGGGCEAGACQPVAVSRPQGAPNYLALGPGTIYWTETSNNSIASAPKMGGNAITLVSSGQTNAPAGIVVDSERMYWGSTTYNIGLSSCPLATCGAPTLPTPMLAGTYSGIFNVALADGSVYAPAHGNSQIIQCPVSAPEDASCSYFVQNRPAPNGIAVDDSGVYWTEDGQGGNAGAIYMCPLSGCPASPTSVAQGRPNPTFIALDANNVYWLEIQNGMGVLNQCQKSNCTNVIALASGLGNPQGLAVDSKYVYWVNSVPVGSSGSVQSCTIGDCETPTTLALSDKPYDIEIDDAAVYWTSDGEDAGIWKLAK